MSSPIEIIGSGFFGTVAGCLAGFLGISGAAILAPMFVFAFGFDQQRAQGISLAALLPPVGLPAVLAYRRSGVRIKIPLVLALIVGFVFGAPAGAWLAHRVPSRELGWCFAAFLTFSAWRALRAKEDEPSPATDAPHPTGSAWLGLPIGALSGALSGLLGVGGAIVAIPLLRRFVRLGRLETQATTLAMLLPPIGLPAVYVYAKEQGGLPWSLLIAVCVGFSGGAAIGAQFAGRTSERVSKIVYVCLLLVLSALVVFHR